jgi:hypothetical protein
MFSICGFRIRELHCWLRTLFILVLVVLVPAIVELDQDSELGFGNICADAIRIVKRTMQGMKCYL